MSHRKRTSAGTVVAHRSIASSNNNNSGTNTSSCDSTSLRAVAIKANREIPLSSSSTSGKHLHRMVHIRIIDSGSSDSLSSQPPSKPNKSHSSGRHQKSSSVSNSSPIQGPIYIPPRVNQAATAAAAANGYDKSGLMADIFTLAERQLQQSVSSSFQDSDCIEVFPPTVITNPSQVGLIAFKWFSLI